MHDAIMKQLSIAVERAERAEAALIEMTRRRDNWRDRAKHYHELEAAVEAARKDHGKKGTNALKLMLLAWLRDAERDLENLARLALVSVEVGETGSTGPGAVLRKTAQAVLDKLEEARSQNGAA